MRDIYNDFYDFIKDEPMPVELIDRGLIEKPYFIYRENKNSDAYLTFRKDRTIAHVDFYHIEYYEVYDSFKQEKHRQFIKHLIMFLDYRKKKTLQDYVIIRNLANKSNRVKRTYRDVIYPFLLKSFVLLEPQQIASLHPKNNNLQYGICNNDKRTIDLISSITGAMSSLKALEEKNIIFDLNTVDIVIKSGNLFRHAYFSYNNHRIVLFFLRTYPFSMEVYLGEMHESSFVSHEFIYKNFNDIEAGIKEFLEINKLAFLMTD